jgi:hypothetical protein
MMPDFTIARAIGLVIGFILGYGVCAIISGSVRYPGIKIHETRIIRLMDVGGWTAKEIHQAILTTFDLSSRAYGLNQLRYDLRKLKGHALLAA